ncbi:vWA domain-containing protein [Sediminicola luteus]|uniref:VWFA domain-containing protein n=1 Tax=Sediminicola luteus TaxID=319238 RepID=A0A2A4G6A2_9FLAO|nr:VWA domain-containing protein [Sediminicola luteus]PCE64177.1 hypothetical protein B7P33_11720 [Sediminicola luteus]
MKINALFTGLIMAFLLISCGNSDDDVAFGLNTGSLGLGKEVDPCLGLGESDLVLSIQDQYTSLPGKISILFKVSETDGTPVAGLKAEQFTIYEQGRNDACFNTISASESFARISPNAQKFNNHTLLVLDLSNSVLSGSLTELKTASNSFIDQVFPDNPSSAFKMGIYWFDGEAELHQLHDFSADPEALKAAIDDIKTDISNDPSTNLYGAVIEATDKAEAIIAQNKKEEVIGAASIVVFTDGTDQAARFSESEVTNKVKNANANISYFTIGLGSEIDTQILAEIGKTASVIAQDKAELEATFNAISVKVANQANSFYLFEYCTPKRDGSGENNLAIKLQHNNLQGAVQTKFNASGFTGGCE